jgi:ATP-binding cassette, subfamily B, bacterial PglK
MLIIFTKLFERLQNLKKLVGKKNTKKLYLLFIILIISSLAEMVSISTIPILALAIVDTKQFVTFLPDNIKLDLFFDLDKRYLISYLCIFIGIVFIIKNFFLALFVYFQNNVIKSIKLEISNRLIKKYLNQNYLFFVDKGTSLITRGMLIDVGSTTIFILNHINLLKEFIVLLSIFLLLIFVDALLSMIIFGSLSLVILIYIFYTKNSIYRRGYEINMIQEKVINSVNQIAGSIKDIKLFGSEKYFADYFNNFLKSSEIRVAKNNFLSSIPKNLLEIFVVFLILGILIGYTFLDTKITELIPYVSLFIVSALRMMPGFNNISNSILTIKKITPNYDYVLNEYNTLSEKNEKISDSQAIKSIDFKKNIILKNIKFKYPKRENYVFDSLNLEIKAGEKLGVVGNSGSGKTTLINLISGLLKPDSGKIYIDDEEIEKVYESWKNLIGYVHQDTFMLNDTIKNNIAFGQYDEKNSDNKISEVVKKAQIADFIKSLEKGFDTIIEDYGKNLSGGQKQRLGIARALYNNPQIIILDEATNSLDIDTEDKFIDEVFRNSKEKTIIFISHKLRSLRKCDRVFDLKQNKFIKN